MARRGKTKRSRNWIFVINNWTPGDYMEVQSLQENCTYVICGKETGDSGTPHLQGYVRFKNPRTGSGLSRLLARAHWEIALGTPLENFAYCSKDGDFEEWGTRPLSPKEKGNQEKQRWLDARDAAIHGEIDSIPADIFVRHYGAIRSIMKDYMKPAEDLEGDEDLKVGLWIHGPAGVGKSSYARERYPNAYKKNINKWWDGYRGEESVIIDDWDPNHAVLRSHLKVWTDRYAFTAEIKGSSMSIRPKTVVITSQYPIEACFPDIESQQAIRRRCEVMHMTDLFNPVQH
jgi:hypothetical protein